ncbi:MAG TPA: type II toxin-antitoxin system PemK/MazF family toxin [Gemmataceae bacterium]|nr:type II toxin-antitoxin system PemK/MazF family toxin [Gemmataceae bacterium]
MSKLCRGRIVWVELLDPQSRNVKCRPAVVVTPDEEIQDGGEVWVVAISTQLTGAPAEVQVALPWERGGHPRTGLKERCAAVCTWMARVKVADVRGTAGIVPGRQLLDILTRIKPPDPPPDPPAPH